MKFLSLVSLLYIFEEFSQIYHSLYTQFIEIFFNIMDLMIFFILEKHIYIIYIYIYIYIRLPIIDQCNILRGFICV